MGAEFKYAAFISYRHVDVDRMWAKWLHSSLESYRLPRQLDQSAEGAKPQKIFRDEEELAASADLSKDIIAALDQSRFLIVVCSPRTAESRWINQEVIRFRELGRAHRILALLIEGVPEVSFPASLSENRNEQIGWINTIEPMAADVRPRTDMSLREVTRIPRPALLDALRDDAAFALRWIGMLNQEVRRLRQQCERLSLNTVEARLLHLLRTEGGPSGLPLGSGLKTLAREIGVTHEALYRSVAALEKRGTLAREHARLRLQAAA